jgi:hypothetical protein
LATLGGVLLYSLLALRPLRSLLSLLLREGRVKVGYGRRSWANLCRRT